jgi:ribose transport system ATP-binding protein
VLIASSEYEDLANLCDRVYVFRDGRVVAELSGAALTEAKIVESAFREVPAAPPKPGAARV